MTAGTPDRGRIERRDSSATGGRNAVGTSPRAVSCPTSLALALLGLAAAPVGAQEAIGDARTAPSERAVATTPAEPGRAAPVALDPVTVTATRVPAPGFTVPASISVIGRESAGNDTRLGASLAEWLPQVPGLAARERQNFAQDAQVSIRGFGTRSAFGIRGLRVIVDGIPATQPDGQAQISHVNLASAERVEVLRGPFSALYGNSAGGVIQVLSAAPETRTPADTLDLDFFAGSFGNRRASFTASSGSESGGGDDGDTFGLRTGATLGASHFRTEGAREHAAAERTSVNGRLAIESGTGTRLSVIANHLDAPDAQDPLGLTRAQFAADPHAASPQALTFDTRKSVKQSQGGAVLAQDLGARTELRLSGYGGTREVQQFLAIPVASQANPRNSGGVVDLETGYHGGDARLSWQGAGFTVVGGVSLEALRQHRRGYENFVGTGAGATLGTQGALRRDERNRVRSLDQFLQLDYAFRGLGLGAEDGAFDASRVLVGVRRSEVRFGSADRYLRAGNPDDSGDARYSAVTPVAGVLLGLTPRLAAYASYGTGFETPTLAELAYRSDGAAGLNFDLDASRSRNAELGVKARLPRGGRLTAALFRADTRGELVTVSNVGGRASFANAARTRRQGAEIELAAPLAPNLDATLAYTWLDAELRRDYVTCAAVPCTTPTQRVPAGNRLPGIAEHQLFARLDWRALPLWRLSAEVRALSDVMVDDVNSDRAAGYAVVDLESRWLLPAIVAGNALRLSVKVENVLDTDYAGSVIVNESNGRFFEAGAGRGVLAGIAMELGGR